MSYVERPMYLNRLKPFAKNGNAKIITGVRRSGKSTMLKELDRIVDGRILRIDMELWENRRFRDPDVVYRHIRDSVAQGIEIIAIDEVQDIEKWHEVVRSLVAEGDCDIYITGSNSKLLSGELASMLTGRCNLLDSFTLTYSECCMFSEAYQDAGTEVLPRLLRVGGFPSVWRNRYEESDAVSEVSDILNSIMMRDIVARYDIRRPDLLHRIFRYFCDNIGNRTSVHNIYNALLAEDRKASKDLVYEYVDHLESACLIYRAETYDVKGKRILTSSYKYYLADIGLKNAVCGFRPEEIQGYIENILYLEMRARGYSVWIGDFSGKEVDFVCRRGNETSYIQAATRLSDEKAIDREFGNLRSIPDNHPKQVVIMERSPLDADIDGIRCVLLEDFLRYESGEALLDRRQRPRA